MLEHTPAIATSFVKLPRTGDLTISPFFFWSKITHLCFSLTQILNSQRPFVHLSPPPCSMALQRWKWRRQQTDTFCTCRRRTHWFSWRRTGRTSSATTTSRCVPRCETWCSASCRNSDLNPLHASLLSFLTIFLLHWTVDSNRDDGGHDEELWTALVPTSVIFNIATFTVALL